ncbi:MAG: ribonuclease P protein component [Gammaproteobacteria bacterium]|nr:ribonuclease P protein component [Gammaproteobacteria bacterium]
MQFNTCFSRHERLSSKTDFAQLFDKSNQRKLKSHFFIALHKKNDGSLARLGIVVKKHTVTQAVLRNQVRRVIRESFRQSKELLKGLDIALVLRSNCTALDKRALRVAADKLWLDLISACKSS